MLLAAMKDERFEHYAMLHECDDPVEHYGIRTGFLGVHGEYVELDDEIPLASRECHLRRKRRAD